MFAKLIVIGKLLVTNKNFAEHIKKESSIASTSDSFFPFVFKMNSSNWSVIFWSMIYFLITVHFPNKHLYAAKARFFLYEEKNLIFCNFYFCVV